MENLAESYHIREQILQVILTNSDSQAILSQTATIIGELFPVDGCAIISDATNLTELALEGRGKLLTNAVEIGIWNGTEQKIPQMDVIEFYRQLLLHQDQDTELIAIADLKVNPLAWLSEKYDHNFPVQAVLGTILYSQSTAKGAILLFKSQSYQWTSSEQQLFKFVSESVVIALSQIQLRQQAQLKSRYQTLLNHLSQEISQSSDLNSLFDLTLKEISQALVVDRGLIFMLKYKDPLLAQRTRQQPIQATAQLISHWSSSTEITELTDKYFFNLTNSHWLEQALKQAPKPLTIPENATFPDFTAPNQPEFLTPDNSSALFVMPLMGSSAHESKPALVLGFLVLQHSQSRLWLADEIDLINWISIQISTAILHHQTLTQVQSIVEERTAQLKWSLDVQAKLSEKMRQQIEQLRKLNELKDDFLNSMSHELKTPLTSMKMAIKMLRQTEISELSREKYLNILEQEWHREYNLIKDLLTLQKVESGEFSFYPQELNLNQIINELAESFAKKWSSDKGLILKTDFSESDLKLYTDAESLQHILNELLLNAGKYSDPETTVELQASRQVTLHGQEIYIKVTNRGAGIIAEELPHIFDKFRRGQGVTDRAVPGTGLGLALVKYLVEHLNGVIEVKSEPINNSEVFLTTFTIKLPQLQTS